MKDGLDGASNRGEVLDKAFVVTHQSWKMLELLRKRGRKDTSNCRKGLRVRTDAIAGHNVAKKEDFWLQVIAFSSVQCKVSRTGLRKHSTE